MVGANACCATSSSTLTPCPRDSADTGSALRPQDSGAGGCVHVGGVVAGRGQVSRRENRLDRPARRLGRGAAVSAVGLDVERDKAARVRDQALIVAEEVAA